MVNTELSNLIKEIRNIPLNDTLSDDALIALSRSYVSMQNLVVANNLDSEYGNRREFEKALDILYRICSKRCQANQPFARRCRMTSVLHMIVNMQMRGVDERKSRQCDDLMWRIVDEWMQNPDVRADRESVCGVLRCIANLYCYAADSDRREAKDCRWFAERVGDWAALTDDDGRWQGVSSCEALCRIEVMSRNSNMFLDTSYDELIETSRTNYCKSVLTALRRGEGGSVRKCGLVLFMLYEVMMWGVGEPDFEAVDAIAESAKRHASVSTSGSDEWLLCQSTVLDRLCMRAGEEIQGQRLAYTA